jgi:hypothetical protein
MVLKKQKKGPMDLSQWARHLVEQTTGERFMKFYLISYDLKGYERNYDAIRKAIEGIDSDYHQIVESAYMVRHNGPAEDVFALIKESVKGPDNVFVSHIDNDFCGHPRAFNLLLKAKMLGV